MTLRRLAFILPLALLAACSLDTANTGGTSTQLTIGGRLERGGDIQIAYTDNGIITFANRASAHFTPSSAVQADTGSSFKLVTVGTVLVDVTTSNGTPLHATLNIDPPPTIVFDMQAAAGGTRDIYRAALDGQDLLALTSDPGDDVQPTQARDNLIFSSTRDGNAELYAHLCCAGDETRLSNTDVNETNPVLAPDGSALVYTRDDGGIPRLWKATISNANPALLTSETGSIFEDDAAWSPASDSLFFNTNVPGEMAVFRIGAAAGSATAPTVAPVTSDSAFLHPTLSPDGKAIAFVVRSTTDNPQLAVFTRATGLVTLVTPSTMSVAEPTYLRGTTDGRIVFSIVTGTTSKLAWVDPQFPNAVHQITIAGVNPRNPSPVWP